MGNNKGLSTQQAKKLLDTLQTRFEKNMSRHKSAEWKAILSRLLKNPSKLWSLHEMERTGGEPDVVSLDKKNDTYYFYDCSPESPSGRRSLCYDSEALESRKEHKPIGSAEGIAKNMGIEMLSEKQYLELQKFGPFDSKTSSWLKTPSEIRVRGGGLFGDYRYGRVFIFHNGAESYYAARGFRGMLKV